VKDLAGLIAGIVVVARVATGCDTNCDPEVETTPGGLKVKMMTCTIEETCDGRTTKREHKFPSQGSPMWNQIECDRFRPVLRADCTYEVELENKCIPRKTEPSDRQPTIIIGVAVASTGYGDTDFGVGGAGGAGGAQGEM
jgi:hypothetical protein